MQTQAQTRLVATMAETGPDAAKGYAPVSWDGETLTDDPTASLTPAEAEYEHLVLVRDLLTDAHDQLAKARGIDSRDMGGTYRMIERALTDALGDTAAVVRGWDGGDA